MKFYTSKENRLTFVVSNNELKDENLIELTANTQEAALEKHLPVVNIIGNKIEITVGSILHPMTEAHLIGAIVLVTTNKVYITNLKSTDKPLTNIILEDGEKPIEVYEYCNLHGLWKVSIFSFLKANFFL